MSESSPENTLRRRPTPMSTTVRRTERLSGSLVRVVLGGGDLDRFAANGFTDAYVKVMFLDPASTYARPIDVEAIRATMPEAAWPRLRTYTVRAWDAATPELTLDFVVHGDRGLAGPWADAAQPGDELLLLGPGGGFAPDGTADWHLYAGDESAIPAIAASLERLPDGVVAHVFVEVRGPADELALTAPASASVTWLHRGAAAPGDPLVDAVTALAFPAGRPQAFVHGEAAAVKRLRKLLVVERGLPLSQLSISGYWRQGADDEAWRAVKREWDKEISESEKVAAAG